MTNEFPELYSSNDDSAQEAEQARAAEQLAWLTVMQSEAGRRVLRRILRETHLYRVSFVSGDPAATAFREGQRNVGLWLLAKLTKASDSLAFEILRETEVNGSNE